MYAKSSRPFESRRHFLLPCVVTHVGRSNSTNMISDTGADTTMVGPQHLHVGLKKCNMKPPPSLEECNTSGSKMPVSLGSFQVEFTCARLSFSRWFEVQGALSSPLLHLAALQGLTPHTEGFPMAGHSQVVPLSASGNQQVLHQLSLYSGTSNQLLQLPHL